MTMLVLPVNHPSAGGFEVDLADLRTDSFLLFPRPIAPAVYDSIIGACRKAGFDPVIVQMAPQIALGDHAGGCRARRRDRAGVDEPAAYHRRRVSRDCG
jgi:hypothetical protein